MFEKNEDYLSMIESLKREKESIESFIERLSPVDRKILTVTAKMISLFGIAKTNLDEVAREVGIGKGTIYRHFGNKKKLIERAIEWTISSERLELINTILKEDFSIETIREISRSYLYFIWDNRFFFRALMESVANEISYIDREELQRRHFNRYKQFIPILIKLQKEGKITKKFDPWHLSFLMVGMMDATVMSWIVGKKESITKKEVEAVLESLELIIKKET